MASPVLCGVLALLALNYAACWSRPAESEVVAKTGDHVTFTWPLPDSLRDSLLVLSFNNASNIVFMATTTTTTNNNNTPNTAAATNTNVTTNTTSTTNTTNTAATNTAATTNATTNTTTTTNTTANNNNTAATTNTTSTTNTTPNTNTTSTYTTTTTATPNTIVMVTSRYAHRLNVSHTLARGLVHFTLSNVTVRDAGRYICMRGPKEADVVEDCGKTLVIVGTPRHANVTSVGPLLTGSDVKLRCAASSLTVPRDHRQPMRFRWFEALPNQGPNGSLVWRELAPRERQLPVHLDHPSLGDDVDTGSGEAEPEAMRGDNSGSLSDVLEVGSLGRGDDGRVFACSASEGLGLWSDKSRPFVIRPQWKPTSSDMTLTPARTSVTLTSGGTTTVTCRAYCRPDCSVVWQKVISDDRVVTVAERGLLSLRHVGHEQQGTYRCVASNSHGTAFTTLSLTVTDPPPPWFSSTSHVIIVVAVVTTGLALGMTGVAVVVMRCRRRTTPIVWPGFKRRSDAVPLSPVDSGPSLVSYC